MYFQQFIHLNYCKFAIVFYFLFSFSRDIFFTDVVLQQMTIFNILPLGFLILHYCCGHKILENIDF